MYITGTSTVNGDFTAQNMHANNNITVDGKVITHDIEVPNSGTLNIAGTLSSNGGMYVTGTSTIDGALTVGSLQCNQNINATGDIQCNNLRVNGAEYLNADGSSVLKFGGTTDVMWSAGVSTTSFGNTRPGGPSSTPAQWVHIYLNGGKYAFPVWSID
jgi:cytoskeletal protein CcmA (bactofilin family)